MVPFFLFIHWSVVFMDKVTSKSIYTTLFIQKWITVLCLVRNVKLCVTSQLMSAMSKLTLVSIWAKASLSEIFTKRAFSFVGMMGSDFGWVLKIFSFTKIDHVIFTLSRYIREGLMNGGELRVDFDLSSHWGMIWKEN